MKTKLIQTKDYLLLIDEEAEIKEWDFYYDLKSKPFPIKQSIENSHKDFKSCKIIAYYPLTNKAVRLDLPWLPKPFKDSFDITTWSNEVATKQFSLKDVKEAFVKGAFTDLFNTLDISKEDFAKEKAEQYIQSLSTQQLPKEFIPEYEADISNSPYTSNKYNKALKALKESSKIGCKLKTITNSEGKEVLVGTYKY